ncbi:MAG: hypothetical protein KAV43_00900, partial [Hadesarchaea archaeon]|nr:hypothetical protein [Hadesarchaea archaeon]
LFMFVVLHLNPPVAAMITSTQDAGAQLEENQIVENQLTDYQAAVTDNQISGNQPTDNQITDNQVVPDNQPLENQAVPENQPPDNQITDNQIVPDNQPLENQAVPDNQITDNQASPENQPLENQVVPENQRTDNQITDNQVVPENQPTDNQVVPENQLPDNQISENHVLIEFWTGVAGAQAAWQPVEIWTVLIPENQATENQVTENQISENHVLIEFWTGVAGAQAVWQFIEIWTGVILKNQAADNQVVIEVTFDRRLSGDRVGQHKAPPLSPVNMTITATVSSQVDNATLADYFPSNWIVTDANGGIVSIHDGNYNKIEWNVGAVSDSVSRSYVIRSPQLTSPPTKYYFHSGLTYDEGSAVSGDWMVMVADPPDLGYNQPTPEFEDLVLCALYENGTHVENIAREDIVSADITRVEIKSQFGIGGYGETYGEVTWYPYSEIDEKVYDRPLWFVYERFWAKINGTWYKEYITDNITQTQTKTQFLDDSDNRGWGLGWEGTVTCDKYNFPMLVAMDVDKTSPTSRLKTRVTTPVNLENHAIEYQLYLNPYWEKYAEKNVRWVRVYYENGDFEDYDIGVLMDVSAKIPDMRHYFSFLTEKKDIEINTFDFGDIFENKNAIDKWVKIESATLPSGVETYVLKIGVSFGPLHAGENFEIDPSFGYESEKFEEWSATTAGTWETKDLSALGVPANAVCEIVIKNSDPDYEWWGGVRATGSTLERRFQLHEAEGGGLDVVTMFVQADADSTIEHYSEDTTYVKFVLIGYWNTGTYVENMVSFTAGADATWTDKDLSGYGVGANQVAEIVMVNKNAALNNVAGVRTNDSTLARLVDLHEAEDGGVDAATMLVKTDASSIIEVYAGTNTDIDFYLVGYWSTAPGTYTEKFDDFAPPSLDLTWEDVDLSAYGVPGNAIAEVVLAIHAKGYEEEMGVRANGSTLDRWLVLHEAEPAGQDIGRMHVTADENSIIEFIHGDVSDIHHFYLIGYWAYVPQWRLIETWTGTVKSPAAAWQVIETWAGAVQAPAAWQLIETWVGTVQAPAVWQIVETWSGTVEAPAAWQLIETWTGTVEAPVVWQLIETWTGTVEAPVGWQLIETWTGTVEAPVAWQLVETWTGTIEAPAGWQLIETWTGTVEAPVAWQLIETWAGVVKAPAEWQLIETWTGTVEAPAEWQLIETWTGAVQAPAEWQLVETWTGTIEAPAEWELIETWTGTVEAPAEWQLIETWTGTVEAPAAWQLIETWTGTVEAPAAWQLIETWTGTVEAPVVWQLIETWTGTVEAPAGWQLIETWIGTVEAPVAWQLVETWTGTVEAPVAWQLVETWTGTVEAPVAWQLIETWTGTVEAPVAWQLIETWTGTVSAPAAWQLVETWTGTIEAPAAWQLIETWTGTVEAPVAWQLVETWTGTVEAPAAWQLIETWTGTIEAPAVWQLVETWTGTVKAPAEWQLVETWTGTVEAPAAWQLVETWTGTVEAPAAWQLIETWIGTVSAPAAWNLIETWTGTIEAPAAWNLIETWTGTIEAPAAWQLVETWTGTVEALAAWQLVETWTGTVEAPAAWQLVETWTGTVEAPAAWQLVETWT